MPSDKERIRQIIKAQELHPIAKLAAQIGERPTLRIIDNIRYIMHLSTPQDYSHIGINEKLILLDPDTVNELRNNPIFGFASYYTLRGIAKIFGRDILEGHTPPEVPLGAASAVAVVNEKPDGDIEIYRKKELGIDHEEPIELQKKIYSVEIKKKEKDKETGEIISEIEATLKKEVIPELKTEEAIPLKEEITFLEESSEKEDRKVEEEEKIEENISWEEIYGEEE